jgi:uncharacterized protein (TIGR02646 family)
MIKLERGSCPNELSDEVKEELTNIYKQNKEKDVWNSPKIKKPLKEALTTMSNSKCSYCECKLGIESKDITIDHFKPKSSNEDIVVEWTNLFPSCLRCNRAKNASEQAIINPCKDNPKEHLALKKNNYRIRPKNKSQLGKDTICVLKLNDIERVLTPRSMIAEKIVQTLEEILDDVNELETPIKRRFVNRLTNVMEEGLKDRAYSAVISTTILNNDVFQQLKSLFIEDNKWNANFVEIENSLIEISLSLYEE